MGVVMRAARRSVMLGTACLTLVLASCGGAHDQDAGLTKADYEALKARRPAADARPVEEPPIPDLQPILAAPQPPSLADSRRVTIMATEPTPVRDLLIEIARKADIDLELDPRIEGGVIITARDRPIADVVERIADLANLRYELVDNRLRVEMDEPYLESYRVDILAQRRQTETKIASSTDVFSAVGEGAAGGTNMSAVSVTSTADADIWTEISANIETIINQAVPEPRTTAVAPGAALAGAGATPAAEAAAAPGAATGQPGATPVDQAEQIAQLEQALAQANALAGQAAAAPAAATATAAPSAEEGNGHYFVVNRQAGIVSAYTTKRQHQKIAKYLEDIQRNTQAQVLIEAKIVEVLLDDQFRAGINWDVVFDGAPNWLANGGFGLNLAENVVPATDTVATGVLSLSGSTNGVDIDAALDFVSRFGTTRTLSSPRLTVLNNQNAVLKVAENEVYFTIEIDREFDDDTRQEIRRTYSSEIHTVPIGVILNVQPSINLDTRNVAMSLRPTISRIARQVNDPAIALVVADINANAGGNINLESPIPVVEVREMDSVVTLQSGDVAVLGGLMQERAETVDEGVPGVKDIPIIGAPFKKQLEDTQVVELVIFLRATIVNGRDSVHPTDVEIYNKFAPDPRPIAF